MRCVMRDSRRQAVLLFFSGLRLPVMCIRRLNTGTSAEQTCRVLAHPRHVASWRTSYSS